MSLLDGLRVLDLSTGIAGPYATKLLADAGAEVIKIEPPAGDPLRRWSASHQELGGHDGALFRYLNTSKRSIAGSADDDAMMALAADADVVVEGGTLSDGEIGDLRRRHPDLVVASVTPWGRTGPAATPSTEFTLQAWCGSTAGRGTTDGAPLHAAGRLGEWISGVYTAVAILGARRGGRGDHVDVSMLECMAITLGGFGGVYAGFMGVLDAAKGQDMTVRSIEVPSIYPTVDGLVGFCTVTGQQFQDFLVLVERSDLIGDELFAGAQARLANQVAFDEIVLGWTTTRTTAEVIELASAFRIPVTEIGRPETIVEMEQFREREVFVKHPGGDFVQPRPPYLVDGESMARLSPSPCLGADAGARWTPRSERTTPRRPAGRPLDGVRIVDLTAFWAGPSATQVLAALGAEVIKVEGLARPDGMRFSSARRPTEDQWWEAGPIFHSVNTDKRGITLDLGSEEGRKLALDLIATADAVIENFSPRVLDGFGIRWDAVHARNPSTIMVRMPSFGLDGPWRDRTGFAQTMEQVSGMAWISGDPERAPVIPRGACDPLAGMHAVVAFLAALDERERTGVGRFLEVSMVEAALNCAAEVVIEHSAYGSSLERVGNRGPVAAPQGVYRCAGRERWIALAVTDDDQWSALAKVLDRPQWIGDERFATDADRRANHDDLDEEIADAVRDIDRADLVDRLLDAGVPAAPVLATMDVFDIAQLRDRQFFQTVEHPIIGSYELLGLPFRFESRPGPWFETAAPMLGQHNREVLGDVLGLSHETLDRLDADGVIGTSIPS